MILGRNELRLAKVGLLLLIERLMEIGGPSFTDKMKLDLPNSLCFNDGNLWIAKRNITRRGHSEHSGAKTSVGIILGNNGA